MNLYNVIVRPVTTEKSVASNTLGKYTFDVHTNSTKIDVKKAVELLYGVKVKDVNIVRLGKKVRMMGRTRSMTKRKAKKRAIITLLNLKKGFDPIKIKADK